MFFLGDFFCGSAMAIACTPTDIDDINKIELSDGWYDDLRVTNSVTEELSSEVIQEWDFDVILHAKFDGNTSAGNVNWNLDMVSHLIIKRKKISDFKWTTLKVQKTLYLADFNMKGVDLTATPDYEYQYAAVPIVNGVEGFYSIDNVEVKTDGIVILDKDEVWYTNITDNYLDNTSVVPVGVVNTMYDRYPTVVSNSNTNYEEVTVNAQFFPTSTDDENGCEIITDDEMAILQYNKWAKMFLRNGKAKILKSSGGQIWLGYVTTPPSDTAIDDYKNRKLSFTISEIGDVDNEEYLWEYGFLDESVTEQYWNR